MKPSLTAIKGTKDILPPETKLWQKAEWLCREVFEAYGYQEIRTPIIEPTELFVKGTGETTDIVTKEMYTFVDKGGRSITLRPEYTPSVVRAIIEHRLYLQASPLRFYYFGPMFRHDRPQKGRYRQFHQVDIEVFGETDPAIDAEIIEMADYLLDRLGVKNKKILVNSVGCSNCRPNYVTLLRAKAEEIKERLCKDCQRRLELNPLRLFDCKEPGCQAITQSLPKIIDYLCRDCLTHFENVRQWLDFYGLSYQIEPRLVRGLDYYTRTTFEIISLELGAQNALLGGGRYDHLMKIYGGPDICGLGFALGLERVLSVAQIKPDKEKLIYFVYLGEKAKKKSLQLCRELRRQGFTTLLEYKDRSLKAQLSRANKLAATWTIILGEDELNQGICQLKEMTSGQQKTVPFDQVGTILRTLEKDEKNK
ncbi:MAG: histidine--tRNA ligase [Candidatus Aminicenantes bacterium]|nr:histidine--tRNA ligase [Candidatus Aminicenantes bacterium]